MTMPKCIKVGMADMNVLSGSGKLRTAGLGSCVGVILYDPAQRIGGLAHVMLPSSEMMRESKQTFNAAKYADTAIPELIRRMRELGADESRMLAKLTGGAQMFVIPGQDTMRIGLRNVESCRAALNKSAIPIQAEDTGGHHGRTIELDCETGIVYVRSVQYGVKEI
jgi:chemotaxis protein CheD